MPPASAVEPAGSALPVPSTADYELAVRAILDGETLPPSDPEQVSRRIIERILEAESFEDAFAPQKRLEAWRSHLGRPATIQGVHFNRSSIKDAAASMYAVVDLTWQDTAEQDTVSCGGRNVLAQLLVGLRKGWFGPTRVVQMVSRDTAEGYTTLYLTDASNPLD